MKGGGRAGTHTEPGAGFGCDFYKASALPNRQITCFRKVMPPISLAGGGRGWVLAKVMTAGRVLA